MQSSESAEPAVGVAARDAKKLLSTEVTQERHQIALPTPLDKSCVLYIT